MNKKEKELIASMFFCEKLNARITPQGCINNQTKQTNNHTFMKKHQINNPCLNCKEGIKRLPDYDNRKIESKICKAFKRNPALCHGNNNGIFYRSLTMYQGNWDKKQYCSEMCRRALWNINVKKTEEYINGDFCIDIKCCNFNNNKCDYKGKDPAMCNKTAKEFHKWLIKKKYKIIKKKDKK